MSCVWWWWWCTWAKLGGGKIESRRPRGGDEKATDAGAAPAPHRQCSLQAVLERVLAGVV